MTAISVTFSPKVAADWDPQKPLTTTKLNQLYDNTQHLREWLGASYTAGAVKDHNHDGTNSALVPVGSNMLRNGSFEEGTASWTITTYSGGTVAINTANPLHGIKALAFTSTVLAQGGGDALGDEYIPVAAGSAYLAAALFQSSVANIASKIEIVWYDKTKAQISASSVLNINTPMAATLLGKAFKAPVNAAYARMRVYGCVPGQGTATGTVYADGCGLFPLDHIAVPVDVAATVMYYQTYGAVTAGNTTSLTPVEVANLRILQNGKYRVYFELTGNGTGSYYAQIYKNGIAVGTVRSAFSGSWTPFTEDLMFVRGDTVQIFAWSNSITYTAQVQNFKVGVDAASPLLFPPGIAILGER